MQIKKQIKRQIFVAIAIILNEKNEVLLGKRHDPRNRGMHGRWEFPGGKVEFGEHPGQTVKREVREEIAAEVEISRLLNVYSWFHPDRPHIQVVIMAYIVHLTTKSPEPKPNCAEIKEVIWMNTQQALSAHIIDHNKLIFKELQNVLHI